MLPNFVALGQTVYEKSVTFLHPSLYFGASWEPLGLKFISLGGDVDKAHSVKLPNFVTF